MTTPDHTEEFVTQLSDAQQPLFSYILTMVSHAEDARDVLSETNLALWRKREEYQSDRPFWPWACSFARFQALGYSKHRQRDRLVFGDQLINVLAEEAVEEASQASEQQVALDDCMGQLQGSQRQLIDMRYHGTLSVAAIASKLGRSAGAISDALYRIRQSLAECIESKISGEEDER